MKFEEAVALHPRCAGTPNWRDYPERNGSVSWGVLRILVPDHSLQQKHFLKR
jgi:hypothetical protein